MVPTHNLNAYRQTGTQTTVHPVKLIHMAYTRVLSLLDQAKEGIRQNDPKMRGENLSKAIALVSELNASIEQNDDGEVAAFLRGLYQAILDELGKVSVSNDIQVIAQAQVYIERLKEIWENTAMKEHGFDCNEGVTPPVSRPPEREEENMYAKVSVSI